VSEFDQQQNGYGDAWLGKLKQAYGVEKARAEAKKRGYRSLPAPATYFGTPVFIPGKSNDTFSSPMLPGPRLEHGLKNVLDGGAETEYFEDICAGDALTVTAEVADLAVRETKAMGEMLIVTNLTTVKNQHGRVVATQRSQGLFY
jgi:hypothetical protein